mgnify:CR=1 FL=1
MKKERRALQLIQEGKLNQAEDLYRELIYRKEVSFEVYGNLAAICAKNSNWEEAKLLLKNSLKINPEYSEGSINTFNMNPPSDKSLSDLITDMFPSFKNLLSKY